MPIILDGKARAKQITDELKDKIAQMEPTPKLTIVTTGNDAASKVYVQQKVKKCEEIGIECNVEHVDVLTMYNSNSIMERNDGSCMILQLPAVLGGAYGKCHTYDAVDDLINGEYNLDVDGLGYQNEHQMYYYGKCYHNPCTPAGIIDLLDHYHIPISGQNIVIIGRSNIVGKPLAHMLMARDATVTICHSKTPERKMKLLISNADIVVSAAGKQNLIMPDWINPSQTLIDVGINRNEHGKLCGDFHPECYNKCYAYTPVPGGVGPMTVAMLMKNAVKAYE